MIVNEPGKYKLTQDWTTRGAISIRQVPAGTILEITQIDKTYHKVTGPILDWVPWDIPVEKVQEKFIRQETAATELADYNSYGSGWAISSQIAQTSRPQSKGGGGKKRCPQ